MPASVIRPRFPRPSSGQRESEKSTARDQSPCRGKHAAPESSQKVLLVRKLCVDRFRKIDILFIHFEFSLACPLETRIKRHTRRPSPCVSVYLRFSPWRFRCLVPSVGQVHARPRPSSPPLPSPPPPPQWRGPLARTRSVRPTPQARTIFPVLATALSPLSSSRC